jgi:cyclic-di-GMP-binding protein
MSNQQGAVAGGTEEHPLATLTGAQRVIATLSADDAVRAAHDAVQWIESLHGAAGFALAHRYAVIERIDLALKHACGRLLDQYLALKPQAKFQEGLLWRAAMGYGRALGNAYLECVVQCMADRVATAPFTDRFPQLVARAMCAQVWQIKWILMRYGYVSDSYWTAVAKLYGYAEAGAFVDDAIEIYAGEGGRGSVRREFLRVMMLGVSSTGGLSPVKQDIAERAIAYFTQSFVSSTQPAPGCNFFFDLHGGMSPARVLAGAPRAARLFYFGAGDALEAAQSAVDTVNETGALPPTLNLGASENAELAADTLLHLAFNWEKDLPARDSIRRKVATTLQVVQGFDGVLGLGNRAIQETWVVENASAEGYGIIVPERRGEWLQVGVLIGLLPEDEGAQWGAGVVRRVETDARGQRRVGVQVLSRAVSPGTMRTQLGNGELGPPHNVVLLSKQPSASGYLQALLRPESFTLRDALEATRLPDGKSYHIMPSGLVESGPDFDRVRFKVV